ncbi:MAG: hypothetical protein LBQ38_09330, partial [Spirochaetaceae bacterium]|nr:hypothetical protein [Spirochaetaceae bacterium]
EFEKLKYPLTLGALSNGVVASTSGHSFGASAAWGETISFKVIPDEGHVLTAVPTATGVTVNSLGMLEYSFVMPKHAVEVNAVFAGQAEATNWALLKAMVGSVEGGTVKIDGSFYTNRSIGAIVIGKPITLIAGGANRTITREPGHTSEFFIVESGGELTLGAGAGGYGITLDGNKYSMNARAQLILVNSRGSLIMNSSNSVLQNNYNEDGDSPRRGGAVSIQPYGSFTLNDGQILGNEFLNSAYAHGGGVFISGNAAFIMNGGTIGYGKAFGGGGVYNDSNGSFTLNSGDISDNHSVGGSYAEGYGGGGVYNRGAFTMNGGRILYNSANEGEKNLKLDGGVFNRNGGEIGSN